MLDASFAKVVNRRTEAAAEAVCSNLYDLTGDIRVAEQMQSRAGNEINEMNYCPKLVGSYPVKTCRIWEHSFDARTGGVAQSTNDTDVPKTNRVGDAILCSRSQEIAGSSRRSTRGTDASLLYVAAPTASRGIRAAPL